jgi:ubiquinone/menaquinone biosynthesis C-methylase UbiE
VHGRTQTWPGNRPRHFEGHGSRVYDFVARRLVRGLYRRIADDIADAAPDGGDVLDVGTGPGVLLVEVARRRADLRLTGVDLSADMAATAQRNLAESGDRATARVGDVAALPFADDSFDLVVSSLTTHHWDDPAGATGELARVLRPGGRWYIYDFGFAPFGVIDETARERSLFDGQPVRHGRIETGVLLFPRCYRHVLTASGARAHS